MKRPYPRLMLAAPGSGSGKTVVTCGLLAALQKRGISCASFKCGPDYIDPMFHKAVLGMDGANLDPWFSGKAGVQDIFTEFAQGKDLSVIEGVMGYYDGVGGDSTEASSYDTACILDTPVVLVVDGKGAGLSLIALLKGFLEYKKDSHICGVIFNRTSQGMMKLLTPAAEVLGLRVYGCLPVCDAARLESRHLGLVSPGEQKEFKDRLGALADEVESYVDIDGLLKLAKSAPYLDAETRSYAGLSGNHFRTIKIGIAEDEAFCFYYQENRRLLEKLGAELVPFSPLHDNRLPKGLGGLILGGGYPELYAETLSGNEEIGSQIRDVIERGMPCLAECGGFLYLQKELETEDGKSYAMAGVLDGKAYPAGRLSRFGYIELAPYTDTAYLKRDETIRAHEFHYWDTTENGRDMLAVKPRGGKTWDCIYSHGNLLAGFPHLYYLSNPLLAERFLDAARNWDACERKQDQ